MQRWRCTRDLSLRLKNGSVRDDSEYFEVLDQIAGGAPALLRGLEAPDDSGGTAVVLLGGA
jgi:hypothetical protein